MEKAVLKYSGKSENNRAILESYYTYSIIVDGFFEV